MDVPPTNDTISGASERHKRRMDRARRLAEIQVTYDSVIAEAKLKHDSLYNTVFNENVEIDEATIVEMQQLAQFRNDQQKGGNFFSRLKKNIPFLSSSEPMMPFVVQSDSAGASLPTIPPSSFLAYKGEPTCEGETFRSSARTFMGNYKKTIILVCLGMVLVLAIGLIVTVSDLRELPPSTTENMRLIKSVLVQQSVEAKPLSKRGSPQYKALVWLAEEMASGKTQYKSLEEEGVVVIDDKGQITSMNEAYGERRELLERFVLVAFHQATTLTDSWLKDDKWLKAGLSVCAGWFGVECTIVPKQGPQVSVVTKLRLSENGMKGPVPNELANLSALTELYLDGNALTGTLPDTLGDLSLLSSLRISENNLTGIVPESVCNLKDNGILLEIESSCGGGSGKIECFCCSECI